VHSRVTEQRASEQMRALRKYAGSRQDIGRAVTMISNDEDNHLAYCHEELLRLASAGHADAIRRSLRAAALTEIAVYRDVSRAVMPHLGRILRWPRPKAAALAAGVQAVYLYERLGGWRRMVSLQPPAGATHSAARRRPGPRSYRSRADMYFSRLILALFR